MSSGDVGSGLSRAELTVALSSYAPAGDSPAVLVVVSSRGGLGKSTTLTALARSGPSLQACAAPWEAGLDLSLLNQLVPGLASHADADVFTIAEQVAATWDAIARGAGLSVLVDDADLADLVSLRALATTVRHHREMPVLVVAAISTDRPSEAGRLLTRMADVHLTLAPVTVTESVELAGRAGIVLHPTLAEHLVHHTSGRPDRIVELLDSEPSSTWKGALPSLPATASVRLWTLSTLADLEPETLTLVQVLAILDEAAPLDMAVKIGGLLDPVVAVAAGERAGLVRRRRSANRDEFELVDPMTGAAVRSIMGPVRELELHHLASQHTTDDVRQLLHAAEARALPDEVLARDLSDLASARAGDGAWATAATLFQAASRMSLDLLAQEERLLLAVDALVGAGDISAASTHLAEVESLRETPTRNAVLGYLAMMRGRQAEAETRLGRAWQLEHGQHHPSVAASTAQRHVLHHLSRCDGASLVMWADRTVELVGPDHPTAVEAQAIRGLGLGATGQLTEALESYRNLAGHAGRGAVGQRVQMGSGWLHLAADEIDIARAQLSTAVPTDYLGGSIRISLWARAWLARTLFVSGEWDLALEEARMGVRLAERSGIALLEPLLQWTVAQVGALRGDQEATSGPLHPISTSDYEIMRVPTCLTKAALAEARADYAGVVTALAPLTRPEVSPDVAEPGFWPWPDVYANALVMQGRLEEASSFLVVHERRAQDRGHRSAQARLGYPRGRLLGALGDLPAARHAFELSLELLAPLPLVFDRARVNFAYGQTLRRAGKRREADTVITAARDDWAALGATTYVRRCNRELKAGGVAATPRERPNESLTPQEQAVADLVAHGATNREAATELFLSVKTVQFHLTRVYAKLGVRSRSELAGLALNPGPDEQD